MRLNWRKSGISTLGITMVERNVMRLLNGQSTEFYISDYGYLIIKQENVYDPHEQIEIRLTTEQAEILLSKLPTLIQEQAINWTGIAHDD